MYLLDFLRHYQVLEEATKVEVRSLQTDAAAAAKFQKAQQRYIESLGDSGHSTELAEKVNAISYKKMTQTVTEFSSVDLGMEYA
jgi:tryptophan 2,3-dioxygenase